MGSTSEHFGDACYEVWRNGGNPDRVNRDHSDNDFYDGRTPEYTANRELRQIRDARERKFQLEAEEEYWAQQYLEQGCPEPQYADEPTPDDHSDDLPF